MWIITTFGFFSAVEKVEDRGTPFLTVRARVRGDIVRLLQRVRGRGRKLKIEDDKRGDYRYRARVRRGVLGRIMADELLALDYQNFKDEVRLRQGPAREGAYHRVWHTLAELQPTPPYGGTPLFRTPFRFHGTDDDFLDEPVVERR